MSRIKAYLGLDIGGTGAKAGVFDHRGRMIGFGHERYEPVINELNHVEIPIETIYTAARNAVRRAVTESRARVCAMAVSSQGQTFVSLDGNDRPLHRAIMWYDARAAEQARRLQQEVMRRGGKVSIQPISTVPKILWLREHLPGVMRKAKRFLLLPDYFAYRLTGRPVIDSNTVCTTGIFDMNCGEYSRPAMSAAGIGDDQVSLVKSPGDPIGNLTSRALADLHLDGDVLLVAGTNDQYAGALGAGNCRPGILSVTTGTCLALVTLTEHPPRTAPAGLICGQFPVKRYKYALTYSKTAGVVLDWFRREFCGNISLRELDRLAAKVPPGSHGITVLPHFDGMFSPRPNPAARGIIAGLSLQHTRADIYRAILEGIAFSMRENIEFMEKCGLDIRTVRAIGGGARSNLWMQIKADVAGMKIEKPVVTEAAVLGAAMLAAVGCGDFRSLEESSAALYRKERVFTPDRKNRKIYDSCYERYRALCTSTTSSS